MRPDYPVPPVIMRTVTHSRRKIREEGSKTSSLTDGETGGGGGAARQRPLFVDRVIVVIVL